MAHKDGSYWAGGEGGKGGYSVGNCLLEANQIIYIVIGGCPGYSQQGGYNGGGCAGTFSIGEGTGGGGATHMAISNHGILPNYKDNKEDILIVAGGGGGGMAASGERYNGGNGGGMTSQTGTAISGYAPSPVATQETGFSFGQGESIKSDTAGVRGGGRRRLARWFWKFRCYRFGR